MARQAITVSGYTLWQDDRFFKLGQDTVLLSAFASLRPGERALDLGAGAGFVGLLTLLRGPGTVEGWELNPDCAALANENYAACGLQDRGAVICADLRNARVQRTYDVCLSNPPYFEPHRGKIVAGEALANARCQQTAGIDDICAAVRRAVRSGGRFYVCWKPEQAAELFAACRENSLTPKRMQLVHQRADKPANLLLLEARRDGGAGLTIDPPLILEDPQGNKTAAWHAAYDRI